ncbi:MAG TPA: tripartite tricarboxylate transporter TctB family protein [Burkholderiales bacterium]|nr:tripartite tricarboxylate transporter TctB family protein [Burkholderiales bacterium]
MRAGFLGALLLVAGGYSYVAFAELTYLSSAGRLGPGFFPRIIGAALVALCAYSLYADRGLAPEPRSPFWRTTAAMVGLSAAFVLMLEVIGGLLSMMAFMAATLALLNRGRHLQNALVALVLPIAFYLLFRVWLNAAIPRGMLPLPF